MSDLKSGSVDPFVSNYHASELKIAAEFITNWLPFLTRDLCPGCSGILTNRVRSLDPGASDDLESSENNLEPSEHKLEPPENVGDDNNPGPAEDDPDSPQIHGTCDTNSLGSWKDTVNESYENSNHISTASDLTNDSPATRLSWADMAQEDEHEEGGRGGSLSRTWADDCEIAREKETSNQKKPSLLEMRESIFGL